MCRKEHEAGLQQEQRLKSQGDAATQELERIKSVFMTYHIAVSLVLAITYGIVGCYIFQLSLLSLFHCVEKLLLYSRYTDPLRAAALLHSMHRHSSLHVFQQHCL
jgi:hypothetical protein